MLIVIARIIWINSIFVYIWQISGMISANRFVFFLFVLLLLLALFVEAKIYMFKWKKKNENSIEYLLIDYCLLRFQKLNEITQCVGIDKWIKIVKTTQVSDICRSMLKKKKKKKEQTVCVWNTHIRSTFLIYVMKNVQNIHLLMFI